EFLRHDGKVFYLVHGDGKGPGDYGYKFLKWIFECRINQWLLGCVHPNLGIGMGLFFSRRSRYANVVKEQKQEVLMPIVDAALYHHAEEVVAAHPEVDYCIFGHYHRPVTEPLPGGGTFVLLGDWLVHFTYGVYEKGTFRLEKFCD
ncbi:MAG: UDP-2,3-diacylglucosamine hydrolase, partial [Bacteroidetes bacterium]